MIGLLIGAGILGAIIMAMEEGEFPGWFEMMASVLAATIPAAIVNAFLPPHFFIVGLAVGAIAAGFAISALCGMTVKRASIAAAIYLAVQIALSIGMSMVFS